MSERPLDAELLSENAANVRAVGGHLVDIANDLDVASKELASLQNENQRLTAENEQMKENSSCRHCGELLSDIEEALDHWAACPKHPVHHEHERLRVKIERLNWRITSPMAASCIREVSDE